MKNNLLSNINDIFTPKSRLGIMAILAIDEESDFSTLKSKLGLSDGNLGAHMNVLEKAGYIEVKKAFVNRRPKTTYKLTGTGRKAFTQHLKQLEAIIKKVK